MAVTNIDCPVCSSKLYVDFFPRSKAVDETIAEIFLDCEKEGCTYAGSKKLLTLKDFTLKEN